MEFDVAVENEGFPARVVYVPMVRFAEQDGAFPKTAFRTGRARWPGIRLSTSHVVAKAVG